MTVDQLIVLNNITKESESLERSVVFQDMGLLFCDMSFLDSAILFVHWIGAPVIRKFDECFFLKEKFTSLGFRGTGKCILNSVDSCLELIYNS